MQPCGRLQVRCISLPPPDPALCRRCPPLRLSTSEQPWQRLYNFIAVGELQCLTVAIHVATNKSLLFPKSPPNYLTIGRSHCALKLQPQPHPTCGPCLRNSCRSRPHSFPPASCAFCSSTFSSSGAGTLACQPGSAWPMSLLMVCSASCTAASAPLRRRRSCAAAAGGASYGLRFSEQRPLMKVARSSSA